MSGIKYLLDTNIVIGLLKASPDASNLLQIYPDLLEKCAVSQITRMELLVFPKIDAKSGQQILGFLESCPILLLDEHIEQIAIKLRRNGRLKLPDAIIAATAQAHDLELFTFDKHLAKAFKTYRPKKIEYS
mgnify:FL=1